MPKTCARNWAKQTMALSDTHCQHHIYTAHNSYYTNKVYYVTSFAMNYGRGTM